MLCFSNVYSLLYKTGIEFVIIWLIVFIERGVLTFLLEANSK